MQSLRQWVAVFVVAGLGSLVVMAQSEAPKHEKHKTGTNHQMGAKHEAKTVEAGQAAPDFTLKDENGKEYKLADYKDKVVVLEWCCSDCPFSNFKTGVGPRAKATAEAYKEKGVVWLAIDSTASHTPESNQAYAKENGISYPILMDTDGTVGRKYGARTTPHVFVIDKGKVVYAGAFGEKPRHRGEEASGSERNYIAESLDAVLAGKEVPVASTTPWGCAVKYARK